MQYPGILATMKKLLRLLTAAGIFQALLITLAITYWLLLPFSRVAHRHGPHSRRHRARFVALVAVSGDGRPELSDYRRSAAGNQVSTRPYSELYSMA